MSTIHQTRHADLMERKEPGHKERGADKVARIPIKIEPTTEFRRKPAWIKAKAPTTPEVKRLKAILREAKTAYGM